MGGNSGSDDAKKELKSTRDDDESNYKGCNLCNPFHWSHRFMFLFVTCFLSFGNYFVYDNPAALQDQFKEDLNINTSQFMLTYSLYSWPNVFLCFVGGFLMDKVLGLRWGAILFAALVTVGQCVSAVGAQTGSYPLVLAGRFIFGLGGENLAVAQNTYAVSWFKGKELNMVFGLQLSFSRVGSTVNMNIMKPIYDAFGEGDHALGGALWIGGIICVFSLLCALLAGWLDKRAARILKRGDGETGEVIQLKDILDFPVSFWLMCVICVAYYVAVFPFIGLALTFYQQKWGLIQSTASTINSLVYVISAVASPAFGYLVDKTGRNLSWCILGIIATLFSHMLLAYTFVNPYAGVIVMGFAYSLVACALWPMVAYVLPEHQLGTAYGFMQALQNLGLAVISMVAGMIVDDNGYLWLEMFFCAWLCLSLLCGVLLFFMDAAGSGILNWSAEERAKQDKEEEKRSLLTNEPEPTQILAATNQQIRLRYMSRLNIPIPKEQSVAIRHSAGVGVLK
ncbi:major facilitator superfamily transporter domain-containing protein 1 [Salpingoeca rosetta]|uniref:Lysosomal dipeptide transporter MFSD1 n=1 Tax=Salpingoeca rosetta (strain ATCC 50818 / BSB-021) TaxID=946362 RepID=F2U147_SALR5|nr:major facilitator superfamily transporter domain-containing protein 1 [Salpingoeca rosetta]EGD80621.1 major facilitator superfamily transporter domain-containing protein 1 [Salpingoeca rosetta]|eukprot:XP_004997182.1 major facilitator superfamily transporter domain-containing protein 1 [Salpingoeca rosetta]